MARATFTIVAVAFLYSAAAAESPPVTFESPCECRDNHGEHRWAVKNDPSTPPVDASAIQAVTPSDVFSWPGPAEHLTQSSERTGIENNWFALTGRVVAVKVEMDGDLHVALQDATGDKAGIVVCEIPAKQQWCSIRESVFSWKGGGVKFGLPASMAGLPGNNACVKVCPPLFCNGPSFGSVWIWSPGPVKIRYSTYPHCRRRHRKPRCCR